MNNPRVCILFADGTNCDGETLYAFELAGGEPERVHVNQLRAGERKLADYQILAIPGGFSYGDDIASGKILAVELITFLSDQLREFANARKLVIGICNGFQVLVKTGLLPLGKLGEQTVTLTDNVSGHFECRWVDLTVPSSNCVWTRFSQRFTISLMVAHGEGKFVAPPDRLNALNYGCQVALEYATDSYPGNPNGSLNQIAGVCEPTGRIFGLMPHPERAVPRAHRPSARRLSALPPQGLPFFRCAVQYVNDTI